jgi:hypothetical protein
MANPTRRDFIQVGATLVVAARGIPLIAESKLAPVIDAHLHCFAGTGDSPSLTTHAGLIVPSRPPHLNIC